MIELDFGGNPNLNHIFECGQCFRWNMQTDGSYIGVANGEVVNTSVDGSKIILTGARNVEFWTNYFDCSFDYESVKSDFAKDNVLARCIDYGCGIRILRQDLFETIISFIISANNNIPRIKGIIERLCMLCGERISGEYHTFPTAKQIVKVGLDKLGTIGAGYRDRYIYKTAKMWLDLNTNFDDLLTAGARKELLKFPGVGPKVADCILLFGLRRFDTFPTDVWVKRLMNEAYDVDECDIAVFAEQNFGEYRGLAQQYLFYYFRDNYEKPNK